MRRVLACCLALLVLRVEALHAEDAKKLVIGALARDGAWTSGRFAGVEGSNRRTLKHPEVPRYISFVGQDWSYNRGQTHDQFLGFGNPSQASYGDLQVRYQIYPPQPNGRPTPHVGYMRRPQPLEEHFDRWIPAPVHAGAFYFRKHKAWCEKNIDNFKTAGEATIDGIATQIIEAQVPQQEQKEALESTHNPNLPATLRLYVAPQFGYVLPRIEEVNSKGHVQIRCVALNFKKYNDLYLPEEVGFYWTDYNKSPIIENPVKPEETTHTGYKYYIFKDIQLVNQDIPESDFTVRFPKDTVIVDQRDPNRRVAFTLTEPTRSVDLLDKSKELTPTEKSEAN